jgi:hypothetical protein
VNEIGNICLFNVVLFGLGYVTGFAQRFEELWELMPVCIAVFLILGIVCKLIVYFGRNTTDARGL